MEIPPVFQTLLVVLLKQCVAVESWTWASCYFADSKLLNFRKYLLISMLWPGRSFRVWIGANRQTFHKKILNIKQYETPNWGEAKKLIGFQRRAWGPSSGWNGTGRNDLPFRPLDSIYGFISKTQPLGHFSKAKMTTHHTEKTKQTPCKNHQKKTFNMFRHHQTSKAKPTETPSV